MTLPAGWGHWGLTHWKPPPVLMQVVPLVQLSWDRAHSSMSAKQGWAAGQPHRSPQADPIEGFLLAENRQKPLETVISKV